MRASPCLRRVARRDSLGGGVSGRCAPGQSQILSNVRVRYQNRGLALCLEGPSFRKSRHRMEVILILHVYKAEGALTIRLAQPAFLCITSGYCADYFGCAEDACSCACAMLPC